MFKPEEVATVVANGLRYEAWQTISVEGQYAVGQNGVARTMVLSVAEVTDKPAGWPALRLKPGDVAQGYLAGQLAISGYVAVRQPAFDARNHALQITVISRAQNTVPATVDAAPGQYKNATLQQIGSAVFGKVGVGFRIEGNPPGADIPFGRVSEHVGESRFGFIERLARWRNLFLRDDENGDIVATRGGGDVVAQLVEGQNILSARAVLANWEAVDQVTISTQNSGSNKQWPTNDVSATAPVVGFPTPGGRTIREVGEQPATKPEVQMRADFGAAVNVLTQADVQVTVQGWLMDEGTLWLAFLGQDVTVFSPMLFPTDSMTLKLKSVKHTQDNESGSRTELNLCLPQALGGSGGADQVKVQ